MFRVRGTCEKCKKELNIVNPGLACFQCRKHFHGMCMDPPHNTDQLDKLIISNKEWYCPKCAEERKRESEEKSRTDLERKEIKDKLKSVREIRELIALLEEALMKLSEKCDQLNQSAIALRKENTEMRRRIRLHELHGGAPPKNFQEWRQKRKLLEIGRKRRPAKAGGFDKLSKEALRLRKKIEQHLEKIHAFKSKKKEKKNRKKEQKKAWEKAHPKRPFKVRFIQWLRGNLVNFTEGWVMQLIFLGLLILYTLLGGLIFWFIEGSYEDFMAKEIIKRRNELSKKWQNNTNNANVTDDLNRYYDFLAEKYGENKKILSDGDDSRQWNYMGAVYFCGTTYSTIGYGDITPVTYAGKVITIVYAIFGIPLFLALLTTLGKTFTKVIIFNIVWIKKCFTKKKVEDDEEEEQKLMPLSVYLCIAILFLMLSALIFMASEGWKFLDAFYFVIVTVFTIGFGDFVVAAYGFTIIVFVVVGLALTSAGISLLMDRIGRNLASASDKLGQGLDDYMEKNENK